MRENFLLQFNSNLTVIADMRITILCSYTRFFFVLQECFYQCSPNVYKWKHSTIDGALKSKLFYL